MLRVTGRLLNKNFTWASRQWSRSPDDGEDADERKRHESCHERAKQWRNDHGWSGCGRRNKYVNLDVDIDLADTLTSVGPRRDRHACVESSSLGSAATSIDYYKLGA